MAEQSGVFDINPMKRERPEAPEPETTVGQDVGSGIKRIAKGAAVVSGLSKFSEIPADIAGLASTVASAGKKGYDIWNSPASQTWDILTSPAHWGDKPNVGPDQIQPGTSQGQPKQDASEYFTGPMAQLSDADRTRIEQQLKDRYAGTIPGTQGIEMQEKAAKGAYDVISGKGTGGVEPVLEAAETKEELAGEREQKIRKLEEESGIKFRNLENATETWSAEVDKINKRYPALTHEEASSQLSGATKFFSTLGRAFLGRVGRELIPSVEEQISNMQNDRNKLFERDINVLAQKEKATLDDVQMAMNRRMQMSDAATKTYDAGVELANAHLGTDLAPLEKLKAQAALGVVTDARERAVAQRNQANLNLEDVVKAQVFQYEHDPNAVPVGIKDGVPQFVVGYTPDDAKEIAKMTPHFKAMQDNINSLMDMLNKRKTSTNAEKEGAYALLKAQAAEIGVAQAATLPKTFTGKIYDDTKIVEGLAKALQTYQNAFLMSRGHRPYLDKRLLNIITKQKGPSASTYATSVTGG